MNGLSTSHGLGAYVASENHVLLKPLRGEPGAKAGCLYSHSLGATGLAALDPTLAADALGTIAVAGLPALSTDQGGAATWGNDVSQTRLGQARTFLQANGAKSGKVVIYAASMGGLAALNWARANPTLVAAIALVCPVVDLAYEHDNNVNGYAASIETAYTNLAGYTAGVATHDPAQNAAAYTSIPIRMWYATNDVIAVTARQTAFAAAAGVQTVSLGAVGHTLTAVPWSDVASFLKSYA